MRRLVIYLATWLDRSATSGAILVVGWCLFLVYAFPGYMSTDSVDQLLQARTGPVSDWHPPLMAMLWRYLDRIVAGPFLMLVLQSALFLGGLAHLLARAMRPRAAALTASALLLCPPILVTMAVIWKDSQMAGFLLAGAAALLSPRRTCKVLGCVLLVFATAQRYNALAATLPIVVGLFTWSPITGLRRYAIATAVWLAITFAAFGLNRAFTQTRLHAWHGSVALFDIAGTVRFAKAIEDRELPDLLADMPLRAPATQRASYRTVYSPAAWWELVHGEQAVFTPPATPADRAAIARAWRELVTTYPRAYLYHRWRVFRELLGLAHYPPGAVWDGFTENPAQTGMIGSVSTHSKLQRAWLDAMFRLEGTFVYKPFVWLFLAFALVPFALRHRLALLVVASGLAYQGSLIIAAPSRDYRYSHWMIVATLATTAFVFALRWRAGRDTHAAHR